MVQINNMGANSFIKYIQNKKLFMFGAGKITENCINIYCQNKNVEAILDNNESLWGTQKIVKGKKVEIISVDTFVNEIVKCNIDDVVMLITPHPYAAEMIQQLDAVPQLDGLECYIHPLIRNTREAISEYDFTSGIQKIPKKIHYFWVGGNPIPNQLKECISSWKVFNPDYEIIRWDESNYDFSKNQYMREAYDSKAWGFVTDYARLDVIYQYGGIYLDADVEVIRNLDVLLCDSAFFGMGSADRINTGVGFGAVAGNPLIKKLRDYYDDKHFVNQDGSLNRVACYYYQHPILEQYGFQIKNEYQKVSDTVIYPPEVLSPMGTSGAGDFFSDKTLSIHHASGTWRNLQEIRGEEELKKMLKQRQIETLFH